MTGNELGPVTGGGAWNDNGHGKTIAFHGWEVRFLFPDGVQDVIEEHCCGVVGVWICGFVGWGRGGWDWKSGVLGFGDVVVAIALGLRCCCLKCNE